MFWLTVKMATVNMVFIETWILPNLQVHTVQFLESSCSKNLHFGSIEKEEDDEVEEVAICILISFFRVLRSLINRQLKFQFLSLSHPFSLSYSLSLTHSHSLTLSLSLSLNC